MLEIRQQEIFSRFQVFKKCILLCMSRREMAADLDEALALCGQLQKAHPPVEASVKVKYAEDMEREHLALYERSLIEVDELPAVFPNNSPSTFKDFERLNAKRPSRRVHRVKLHKAVAIRVLGTRSKGKRGIHIKRSSVTVASGGDSEPPSTGDDPPASSHQSDPLVTPGAVPSYLLPCFFPEAA